MTRRSPGGWSRFDRIEAVSSRELATVSRSRSSLILVVAFVAVVAGFTIVGDGHARGYGPTVLDLVTPAELLVPVFALAMAYRAVLDDARRGELDLLRTSPLTAGEHMLGVFAARAAVVAGTVLLALAVAGAIVALTPPETVRVFATADPADSPLLFARFAVLAAALAVAFVAVGLLVSTLVTSVRSAQAVLVMVLLGTAVGFDLAIARGVATGVLPDAWLATVLGLGPLSAFRGLVLETAVPPVQPVGGARRASPVASALGLGLWTVVSLAVAAATRDR